jgi:amidase
VDFIALPTVQSTPKRIPPNTIIAFGFLGAGVEALMLNLQNTVAVNFAGNPALALPIPLPDSALKDEDVAVTSLQLVGPSLGEAQLLNAGRLVEAALKK